MEIFKNSEEWKKYLKRLNDYGGGFKHRWGDIPTLGLFGHTHFFYTFWNLDISKSNLGGGGLLKK